MFRGLLRPKDSQRRRLRQCGHVSNCGWSTRSTEYSASNGLHAVPVFPRMRRSGSHVKNSSPVRLQLSAAMSVLLKLQDSTSLASIQSEAATRMRRYFARRTQSSIFSNGLIKVIVRHVAVLKGGSK